MDNLDEMQKFLEKYNLPKLNKEEILTDPSQTWKLKLYSKIFCFNNKQNPRTRWLHR